MTRPGKDFAAAVRHHQAGNLPQAETIYRRILRRDARHADALHKIGLIAHQRGQHETATEYIGKAIAVNAAVPAYHNNLGAVFQARGHLDQAEACYREALRLNPSYAEAHQNLGLVLRERRKNDFSAAVRHHQAGNLPQAETIYRRLLRHDARHADALHLLGVIAHQQGQHETATEYIGKAIAVNAVDPAYHNNLGAVYQAQGHLDQAEACYREALRLNPSYAEAHYHLGLVLKERRKADEALFHFREAVRLKPDYAEAHNKLGALLHAQGDLLQACIHYREALRLSPDSADALNNLGTILQAQGQLPEAREHYRQALRLKPDLAEGHRNLGTVLQAQGQLPEALERYREALRLKPDYAEAHNNLGTILQGHGQVLEALVHYRRALRLKPDYAEANLNHAHASLLLGDVENGWPGYEWRWKLRRSAPCSFPQQRWDGTPLGGRTILLHAEQGLGDTIQFIRYAPLVKRRGGSVIVRCQLPLVRLLATCPGIDRLITDGTSLPHFDVHAPLLSLPGIFRTTLDSIPADVPYLWPPQGDCATLDTALNARSDALRVGIVWAGRPTHENDHDRSCAVSCFQVLTCRPDVALFSLQKGPRAADLLDEKSHIAAIDLGPLLGDFADTAAAIARLDLVITVDTAVAHLAGALGKPVWLLLPFAPDWRWLLEREDSPWYPTMRLFRQSQPGDWPGVFDRVGAALAEARPNTVHIRFDADVAFKQIPPTPLCQRGARGDFAGRRPK